MIAKDAAEMGPVLVLDTMPKAGQVSGKRHWVHGAPPRARKSFLARFTAPEDAPSFYLSLSDLMCLLVVFFVLVLSMTTQGVKTAQREATHLVRAVLPPPVTPAATQDPWPAPAPVAKHISQGLAAVAGEGSAVPGLVAEPAEKPRPEVAPAPPISRALLALVSSSSPANDNILPQEETSLSNLLAKVEQEVSGQSGVEVEKGQDRLILRLPEAITFDLGQAEIKPAMRQVLGRLADALQEHADYRAVVTGHTDDLPINTPIFASNWELSGARAAAVARALIDSGLDPKLFSIQGLADTRPQVPNSGPENRRINRRVEIELRSKG